MRSIDGLDIRFVIIRLTDARFARSLRCFRLHVEENNIIALLIILASALAEINAYEVTFYVNLVTLVELAESVAITRHFIMFGKEFPCWGVDLLSRFRGGCYRLCNLFLWSRGFWSGRRFRRCWRACHNKQCKYTQYP